MRRTTAVLLALLSASAFRLPTAMAHEQNVVHSGLCAWSSVVVASPFYDAAATQELRNGTVDEDNGTRSLGHFYNPKLMAAPSFSLGAGPSTQNSRTQWDAAVTAYAGGTYYGVDAAFHRLGRAMHFMQDATSPAHVHDDAHPPTDPCDFEDWGPGVFPGYDFSTVVPKFAAVRTPEGYVSEVANQTYDLTAYDVELDEQPGAQVASEYRTMFPSLIFIDGGLFGDDRWEVDRVGCFDCVFFDDWWVDDFGQIENSSGRGGTRHILGTAYIENTGGTGGDPIPLVWNGVDNSAAQKTLRQLQGDRLYAEAIAYGAGMMIDFMTTALGPNCGNGAVNFGEQCDDGNTTAGDCCSPLCQFEAAGTACRAAAGVCDVAETCTGTSGSCPANGFAASTVMCRASVGPCDTAETCSGGGPSCPADTFVASSTVCRPATGVCDVAETCTGTGAACPLDGIVAAGTTCRPSAGSCDVAETCTGTSTSCPPDGLVPAGTSCRASAGVCDTADTCTGTSASCPADAFVAAGTSCRASAGVCDAAETCTGSSASCPPDAFVAAGTSCRASAGVCDAAETCTGTSASCPVDAFAPAGTSCRASAGVCDTAETCTGTSASCPANAFVPAGTSCRASAGVCDTAETCTGTSASCPPNAFVAAGTSCRASAGVCDTAETCTGTAASCPPDAFVPAGTSCRASAGVCDTAETCTGASASCPPNAFVAAGTSCRASAGACDTAETCTGTSAGCPPDALAPAGTSCRGAVDACDAAETCTGSASTCPADESAPDGTSCDDGNACTGTDVCTSGVCAGTGDIDGCTDDFLCYQIKAPALPAIPPVSLVDEFETTDVTLSKMRNLCTPADTAGEGVLDPVTHLVTYSFRNVPGTPRHVPQNVTIVNALGTLALTTTRPELLLVPAAKNLVSQPTAPPFASHDVDHYKCYKVKVTSGTTRFPRGITTTISDQFRGVAGTFAVKKPRKLCNPVDKNGEGIKNAAAHLVCYSVKATSGTPPHQRTSNVRTASQFGNLPVGTTKEKELCLPSTADVSN